MKAVHLLSKFHIKMNVNNMKRIVVIEDNTEVRENLCEILTLSGYETFEAENGKIGIQVVTDVNPDLIICDVMMPELDGFGVLKILNHNPKLMHIPFMFLTAKAEKTDFRKGMGLGADDYITKPYDDVELLEAIEMRLKKSEKLKVIDNSETGLQRFFDEAKGEKELNQLSVDRESRSYSKKERIYEYGQFPKWIFFIVSGQVKCYQTNEFGKELITHVYGQGDFFGFLPHLMDSKYEDSAMTTEDTVLSMIPPEDFKILLYNNRNFSARFIKLLANHVDHSERKLIDLAYSSVRRKVANALLTLHNKSLGEGIAVLREDLASLAGTAKETTIRTLGDFKSEGIIEIKSGSIEILEMQALKDMPQ
jgi:CheY-like chemotaxis protein/CRP-like cAMP-binding protein